MVMASTQIDTSVLSQFETGHQDTVHDAQLDFYGKSIATASSDRLVKVFRVENSTTRHVADLVGHQGPVYQVAFSNPKGGSYLASASFDGSVIIWQNRSNDSVTWEQAYQAVHQNGSAVNSVAWAPYADTKMCAGACADGSILIAELQNGAWSMSSIPNAHDIGAMDVSFAPQIGMNTTRRLATCGCDGTVKVWMYDVGRGTWVQDGGSLVGHGDWVRSVEWAPAAAMSSGARIVSAGQDGSVVVWKNAGGEWTQKVVVDMGKVVYKARWNGNASLLAVTSEDQAVTLFKEVGGGWMKVSV